MTEKIQGRVEPKANVYFGGKCVSHGIELPDGKWASVGVVFPSTLVFNTGEPEKMTIVEGSCRVQMKDSNDWTSYKAGDSFNVPGKWAFEIEVLETVHYICHFG